MRIVADKIVVITGGTKGIGLALAKQYREWGNIVIVMSRSAEDNGKDSFACDVSKSEQVESVFTKIYEVYGKIDILINNVGMGQAGAIEFLENEMIEELVNVNLYSVIYCTKAVLKRATAPLKIINISSASAYAVLPFRTMYSVTKEAINIFTLGLRVELHNTGIEVCSISLGDSATDFGKHHPNNFTTSARYGNRITDTDNYSAERSESKVSKDKRMPVDKVASAICNISAKDKFGKYTYFIGAKYKFFHFLSHFISTQNITEIVRRIFEKSK